MGIIDAELFFGQAIGLCPQTLNERNGAEFFIGLREMLAPGIGIAVSLGFAIGLHRGSYAIEPDGRAISHRIRGKPDCRLMTMDNGRDRGGR